MDCNLNICNLIILDCVVHICFIHKGHDKATVQNLSSFNISILLFFSLYPGALFKTPKPQGHAQKFRMCEKGTKMTTKVERNCYKILSSKMV